MRRLVPALAWVALTGCARSAPEEPRPAEPPAEAEAPPEADAPPARTAPVFTYRGWPGEGIPEFTTLRDTTLELHEAPGGEVRTTCDLPVNASLPTTSSVVLTERAAPVPLDAPRELPEGSIAYGGLGTLDPAAAQGTSVAGRAVGPDSEVLHLQYRAEGSCLYRIDDDIVETTCFHDPARSATASWWVQAECGESSGWVRVGEPAHPDLRVIRRF